MKPYKGYNEIITYDSDDNIMAGKVFGISDYVGFHGESIDELEQKFHEAVDDYLALCKEAGKNPEKEFKGSFNVRIKPELHRDLAEEAATENISLNAAVEKAIEEFVKGRGYHLSYQR